MIFVLSSLDRFPIAFFRVFCVSYFLCCFYWFVVDCLFMVCFDLLIAMRALQLKRMIRAKSELNFHWVLNVLLNRYRANLSDIISGIFNIKSFHCYLIIFLKWSANVALSSSKILMFFSFNFIAVPQAIFVLDSKQTVLVSVRWISITFRCVATFRLNYH